MAEAGAVIVNGSQAHRPKAMTFEHGTFIDYGLGNLFFDQMGIVDNYGDLIIQTRWEVIQRHTFYDGRHLNTELLTAMLEDYAQPRPMTERERLVFLEELFTASGWESR
jgi:poly-gamma-glutamate synthesis protein (capsule biosynthesis protein)